MAGAVRRLTFLALLFWLLLAAGAVAAHQPTFNRQGSPSPEEAFVIDDVGLSLAIYGALQQAGAADYYRLEVPAGHRLDFQLFVPAACEGYRPQMALLGPEVDGQPPPIDLAVPDGLGVAAVAREEWGTFFEPFDPAFYAAGPTIDHQAAGGTYYVAVYNVADQAGAYLLGMAGREEFSGGDGWRSEKARYDRCEVGPNNWFWQNWRRLALAGTALLVVAGAALFVGRRRARSLRSS